MSETLEMVRAGMHPSEATTLDRDDAIALIRESLKRRSGKAWSVKGGRGTGWGWITIASPPARRVAHYPNPEYDALAHEDRVRADHTGEVPSYLEGPPDENHGAWYMSEADRHELGELMGQGRPVFHCQGLSIPDASDYRRHYVALALGKESFTTPVQYWD